MRMPSTPYNPGRRGFSGKIILIVLTIVALSQALGTFLSVLSYEEIYLKALLSKYEILGKDLNRQIQQALKFGKPLDRFLGMDRLVEALLRRADELDEVSIFATDGRTLFSFQKTETVLARFAADDRDDGTGIKVLLDDTGPMRTRSTEDLKEHEGPWPLVRLSGDRYHLFFPVKAGFSGLQGYLELAFDQAVLDAKTWELVRQSMINLLVAVVLTGIAVALLIRFLFARPARRAAESAEAELFGPSGRPSPAGPSPPVPGEIYRVRRAMEEYVTLASEVQEEVRSRLQELERTVPESDPSGRAVRLMQESLPEEAHEDD